MEDWVMLTDPREPVQLKLHPATAGYLQLSRLPAASRTDEAEKVARSVVQRTVDTSWHFQACLAQLLQKQLKEGWACCTINCHVSQASRLGVCRHRRGSSSSIR